MSVTALDMITDALRIANIIDENETPSAEQGVAGLRSLNQMVAQWVADGIRIPWHIVAELEDELPIDVKDERGLKYNLAQELATEYGVELLPRAQAIAEETYDGIVKRYRLNFEMSLDHLPYPAGYPHSIVWPME